MMATLQATNLDESGVLTKAVLSAGKALGLTQADIGHVIGKDRTSIARRWSLLTHVVAGVSLSSRPSRR